MRAWSSVASVNSHDCADSAAEQEEQENMEIAAEEGAEQVTGDMDGMDMMNQNELDAEMDIAMNGGLKIQY